MQLSPTVGWVDSSKFFFLFFLFFFRRFFRFTNLIYLIYATPFSQHSVYCLAFTLFFSRCLCCSHIHFIHQHCAFRQETHIYLFTHLLYHINHSPNFELFIHFIYSHFSFSHLQNNFLPVNRLYDWKRCHRSGRNTNTTLTGECGNRHWIAIDCNWHRRHKTMCVSVWWRSIQITRAIKISGDIFLAFLSVDKCRILTVDYNHSVTARNSLFRGVKLFFAGVWRAWTIDGCVNR